MKNKKIFPLHLFILIIDLFIIIIFGGSIAILICGIIQRKLYYFISGILGIILFCFALLSNHFDSVKFFDTYLYTRGEFEIKEKRMQYKLKVKYVDIKEISVEKSCYNSLGKSINRIIISGKYIRFRLKNGKNVMLHVTKYSKKQKIKILDEIKLRAASVGNKLSYDSNLLINELYEIKDFIE